MTDFTADAWVSVNLDNLTGGAFLATGSQVDIIGGTIQSGTQTVNDNNNDGNLDKSGDTIAGNVSFVFSGYTFNIGGTNYPVFSNGSSHFLILDSAGLTAFSSGSFPITSNVNTDNAVAYMCFAGGTKISTPEGSTPVENIRIGDLISGADGTAIVVKWIGRQTVSTCFGPAERLMPVRFGAGSLGDGLPHTDLTVTADHGMLVDGVICHAGALVNGTTITRVPLAEMGDRYTVYHIETEAHEIILANGAPAETFIDNVGRRAFDNYAEFEALYGEVPEMEELPYPRAMSARQVPSRIKSRLSLSKAA